LLPAPATRAIPTVQSRRTRTRLLAGWSSDPSGGQHLAAEAFRPGAAEPRQGREPAGEQQQDRGDRPLDFGAVADGPRDVGGGEPEPSDGNVAEYPCVARASLCPHPCRDDCRCGGGHLEFAVQRDRDVLPVHENVGQRFEARKRDAEARIRSSDSMIVIVPRGIGQWDAQAVAGAFRDASTAASTCRRVVGKIGTELSAAEISSSISVQPSTTPSTPARTRRVMTSR